MLLVIPDLRKVYTETSVVYSQYTKNINIIDLNHRNLLLKVQSHPFFLHITSSGWHTGCLSSTGVWLESGFVVKTRQFTRGK